MSAIVSAGRRPTLTAFVIWFVHFMLCWGAVELWPDGWRANQLAWAFTAIALLAMGLHGIRLYRNTPREELSAFSRRFERGAIAIATVAVLFTALPSIVFLP